MALLFLLAEKSNSYMSYHKLLLKGKTKEKRK
jgi:hypothetical protein